MLEDVIVSPVVDRTANSEHRIAGRLDPPCARALHACVADELVGRLDAAAPDGIAPEAQRAVIDPLSMFFQIADELADELCGLR